MSVPGWVHRPRRRSAVAVTRTARRHRRSRLHDKYTTVLMPRVRRKNAISVIAPMRCVRAAATTPCRRGRCCPCVDRAVGPHGAGRAPRTADASSRTARDDTGVAHCLTTRRRRRRPSANETPTKCSNATAPLHVVVGHSGSGTRSRDCTRTADSVQMARITFTR